MTIRFVVEYRNYGDDSSVSAKIKLNSKVLKTLVDINYKHCGG